jgi:hypothetical protein
VKNGYWQSSGYFSIAVDDSPPFFLRVIAAS